MSITLRAVSPADLQACARIIFTAFESIAQRHNFPLDFPNEEASGALAQSFLGHPHVYGMAAEVDGTVAGFNFLDERTEIGGVGPMVVDPAHQGQGIGRKLMQAIVDRGASMRGIRLVQDAFNTTSMSLYASLGFDAREPLALMSGKPKSPAPAGTVVRAMTEQDLPRCAELCRQAHGFDRTGELRDGLSVFQPQVLARGGRVVAYASAPWFWPLNHGVAETEQDMRDLLLGAAAGSEQPLMLLHPIRQADRFRWLLREGVRIVKPMTLMTLQWYQEPATPWYASVQY